MGLVQATGRDNARRATGRLLDLGYLAPDEDLEKSPTRMLDPDVSAAMLYVGLMEGWYTGRKLSDYFGNGRNMPANARAIVNPDSNGAAVATIFTGFRKGLKAAGHVPGGIAPSVPTPPVTTTPVAPIPAVIVVPQPSDGAGGAGPLVIPLGRNDYYPDPAPTMPTPLPPVTVEAKPNWLARFFRALDDRFGNRG